MTREYIKKENGYVYQVIEHDIYGKHKTVINLGKDYEYWKKNEQELKDEDKSKKKTKKKETSD